MEKMSKESEFGRGLCYCLGLFLAHERDNGYSVKCPVYIRFNAAGDHLFELEIPDSLPGNIKTRLKNLQSKVLIWRLPMQKEDEPTIENFKWAMQETKDLLRLIDKYHGIKTCKGDWE